MLPVPRQPRQQILQLRQLDLQLAGLAVRTSRKDVEDQLAAVDDLDLGFRLQIALLCGRQGVVENNHVSAEVVRQRANFLDLAAADEGCRMNTPHLLHRLAKDTHVGGFGETLELGERLLAAEDRILVEDRSDEDRSLRPFVGRDVLTTATPPRPYLLIIRICAH